MKNFQNKGYGKKIFLLCQKKIGKKNKLFISEVKNNNKKSINFLSH